MVLNAPALARVFALAAHEIGPAGLAVRQLAPAGIREDVADARADDVVVVGDDDVAVENSKYCHSLFIPSWFASLN